MNEPSTRPEPTAEAPALALRGVTAGYDGTPVLEDVDLAIGPRDYLAILGPNGGGKTTLLRVFLGLVEPWRGQVISNLPHGRRRLGYVPQYSSFEPGVPLRVEDVALMGRLARRGLGRRYRPEDLEAARRGLAAVRLEHRAHDLASDLSGGQIQRLLIARALAGEPEVLILDEPTSALDAHTETVVRDSLNSLRGRMTVLVIAHRLSTLDQCDRIMVVQDGRLTAFDTPTALRASANFYADALRLSGLA